MSTLRVIQAPRPGSTRVIDENGEQLGVMSITEALDKAHQKGLDLVEVAPQANPPVCKLADYGKLMYQQSKKEKKSKSTPRKEIRMGVRIADHDLETKVRNAERFLDKGHKVLVTVLLKGREKATPKLAMEVLDRFMEKMGNVRIVKPAQLAGNKADVVFIK